MTSNDLDFRTAQSRARQILMMDTDARFAVLRGLRLDNPKLADVVEEEIRKLQLVVRGGRDTPVNTHVTLWKKHWRDIKLHAFALRFYQHQTWEVKAGDIYCITRHGPALYQVAGFTDSVMMRTLYTDQGPVNPEDPPKDWEWEAEEFTRGGFAASRIHIPHWIWDMVAKEHAIEVDWSLLNPENNN